MVGRHRGYLAGLAVLGLVFSPAPAPAEADLGEEQPRPAASAPEEDVVELRILGVNDLHGNLEPPLKEGLEEGQESGGAAYLDAHLDRLEGDRPGRTIRAHAGDMVGGSPPVSSLFHDEPTILAMNAMRFDVGTLGNHEFDEGEEEMLRLLDGGRRTDGEGASDPFFLGASFPYVAANTVYDGSGATVRPPRVVLERAGVRIGFIGVTTPDTAAGLMPNPDAPFRFLDISETVNRQATALQEEGVEAIVVLAHAGGTAGRDGRGPHGEIFAEAVQMSEAVDVILAGHTHGVLDERVGNKLVVEAGEYGKAVSVVDLTIDRRTGHVTRAGADVFSTRHAAARPDRALATLVDRYKKRVAPVTERVISTAATDVTRSGNASGESSLGDLIADAQRSYAGADLAFVNPAGLRANLAAGPVTYGELATAQPFGDEMVRMELSGDAVLRLLEQQHSSDRSSTLQVSGLRYALDASNPKGRRVTQAILGNGESIERGRYYSVATDDFLAAGGDGFTVFEEGRNRRVVGEDVEVLASYLRSLPRPFAAPDPNGERRINAYR